MVLCWVSSLLINIRPRLFRVQWGHNFRPDYLRLADFAKAAKAKARLALTATATPKVCTSRD